MSKIKKFAIEKMGEDEFEAYLDEQMKGEKDGERA